MYFVYLVVESSGLISLFVVYLLHPLLSGIGTIDSFSIVVRNIGSLACSGDRVVLLVD